MDGPGVVRYVEVPRPEPAPGELLVHVEAAAICATDRRIAVRGADEPRIPGHEVAGTLEDGTPVGIHPNVGCGVCEACLGGFENRCDRGYDIGIQRDGGLAEWVAVPEGHIVALDGFDVGLAPLVEPLACVLHALSVLGASREDHALVVGAGSLGVIGMWAFKALGARVAVMQRSEERRHLAAELGADAVLGPGDDLEAVLGEPPRVALITAPGALPLEWALERVARGGSVHAFAGTPGGAPVDANLVHYRHVSLAGSTGSTVKDYRHALEMARSDDVPLDRMPRVATTLSAVGDILLDSDPDPRVLKHTVAPATRG